MKNSMQILNKTEVINKKIEQLFLTLQAAYKKGEIKSEAEFTQRLFYALNLFYDSIGKPGFKFEPAIDTPVSSDYDSMVSKFIKDVDIIFSEIELMYSSLKDAFESIEVERQMMQTQIRFIIKKINDLRKNPKIENGAIYFESFTSEDMYDKEMSATPSEINTVEGLITLKQIGSENHTPFLDLSIMPESNGIPGNTHVIASVGDSLKFEGEDNLNINPRNMIDENRDTWFDFEIFKMKSETYDLVQGLGLTYKEGKSWVTEDGKLKMVIKLESEIPRVCNWLTLSPFLPEHKGAKASFITDIVIDSGKGMKQSIVSNPIYFNDDIVFSFEKQEFRFINISFEQILPYETDVGHIKYTEVNNINSNLFNSYDDFENLVEGFQPSLSYLGVVYDPRTKLYNQPSTKVELNLSDESIKNKVFDTHEWPNAISSKQILKASRFHIGIKNISVMNKEYLETSEFVTKEITVKEPIKELFLNSSYFIPEGLSESDLLFDVSFNNGLEWNPILPLEMVSHGVNKYIINSFTPSEVRNNKVGYLDYDNDVYSYRLRVTFKRPKELKHHSPVVKNIRTTTLFGGE